MCSLAPFLEKASVSWRETQNLPLLLQGRGVSAVPPGVGEVYFIQEFSIRKSPCLKIPATFSVHSTTSQEVFWPPYALFLSYFLTDQKLGQRRGVLLIEPSKGLKSISENNQTFYKKTKYNHPDTNQHFHVLQLLCLYKLPRLFEVTIKRFQEIRQR